MTTTCVAADRWEDEMRDKPCWLPAPPFWDICRNADSQTVKHMDCDQCFKEHPNLKDYIE